MPRYRTAKPKEPVTLQDMERYASKDLEPWVKALVFTLWAWGIRIAELVGRPANKYYPEIPPRLRTHLTINEGYLWLNAPPIKNKQGQQRNLPIKLDTPFIDWLLSYANTLDQTSILFPYSSAWCWAKLKKIDPTLCAHRFRHNRASKMALSHADPYEIQGWLGHTDVRMASTYIHSSGVLAEDLGKRVDIR